MTKQHDKMKNEIKNLRQKIKEIESMNQLFKDKIKQLLDKNRFLQDKIDEYFEEEIILLKPQL